MQLERRWVDRLMRTLIAPLLAADSPLPGWRVLGWDAEQGLSLTLVRGDRTLLIELERKSVLHECYARTERFNVCARRAFADARDLDDEDRRTVDDVLAVVRAREQRLPRIERAPAGRRALARQIAAPRVLIPEGPGHYYINPYVGCTIGCEWCYVAERADFSRELEGLPKLEWGRWVDVKEDAPSVLGREVKRFAPGIVRLSPILTDPYQPIERSFRVTRRCLEVLLTAGFSPCILTRATRVLDDLGLITRFAHAAVGFSIPTDDDSVRRAYEPGADPIPDRIDALARCRAAGLRTFAVIQPVFPGDPERLAARLAPLVDVVRIDRMYGGKRLELAELRERTRFALERAFVERGVPIAELDDLTALVFGGESCAARI